MNWILILAIVIIVFLIFKSKEIKHRVITFLVIIVLLFFLFSFSQVTSNPSVNFSSFDGIISALKLYLIWFKGILGNVGTITGNAIRLDWGANFTNLSVK